MRVSLQSDNFKKDMQNIIDYSIGFVDGIKSGKRVFLNNLGKGTIQALSEYIDANARMNPNALHHVYEWYQTGSPDARLFDINYTVSNLGLSINSTFRQSSSLKDDMKEPFYNKARIMESGIPVTISPKAGVALVFKDAGKTVFSRRPITIPNPGGPNVTGSYEATFDAFFKRYFTQAFLRASGVLKYLENPEVYRKNLKAGSKSGRSLGVKTGYTWIANAKIGVNQ